MYDVHKVRADFPILSREVNGKPLIYLDNGASAQKPRVVIDAMTRADGDCGSPAVDDVPEEPYLFVAVDRGLPDIASLYWCREPKDCVAPFASVWLVRLPCSS